MKLISWNVNGFRAILGKGFADIFEGFGADVVCLQETKMQPGQAEFSQGIKYRQFPNLCQNHG